MCGEDNSVVTVRAVIDRIEGQLAVLEMPALEQVLMPVSYIPRGCGDGAILEIKIRRDLEEEEKQRKKIRELRDRISGRE